MFLLSHLVNTVYVTAELIFNDDLCVPTYSETFFTIPIVSSCIG